MREAGATNDPTADVQRSAFSVQHSSFIPHPSSFPSGWVRVGFGAIKNFPLDLAQRIVRIRKEQRYGSFEDFLHRVRPSHEATEKLVRVGAFDCFGIPRERLFLELDLHFRERADNETNGLLANRWINSKTSACNPKSKIQNLKSDPIHGMADEIELLGYGVSAHPLELLPDHIWRGVAPASRLSPPTSHLYIGRRVTMIGWLIASKLVRTKQKAKGKGQKAEGKDGAGEFMKFLSLEDLTGTFEVTLFPRAYRRFAPLTLSTPQHNKGVKMGG
ncbi:hypothetical protein FJY63_01470 [Candidatus Sumerlaeota bacterium]|nr:hypothetical protein [Candidatus Sumerlaeota bacterium]